VRSLLDLAYSTLTNRNRFFSEGWGDKDALAYLLSQNPRDIHNRSVKDIQVNWMTDTSKKHFRIREGYFESPFAFKYKKDKKLVTVRLPEESKRARIKLILPKHFHRESPLVLHYAATGDEGFQRRLFTMALPLVKLGIGSIILENPFYGQRKPKGQNGAYLNTFTDFLKMARATTDEGIALLRYFRRLGHRKLGVSGISMGGYVALSTAARSEIKLAVAACVPSHSGSPVYLEGALARACDWEKLDSQLTVPDLSVKSYMKSILDQSDLQTFTKPKRPDAIVVIGAKNDGYIPEYSTNRIKELWPEITLKWIPTGHVGSLLFHARDFRQTIQESFDLLTLKTKY
jgi:hypothetical protein